MSLIFPTTGGGTGSTTPATTASVTVGGLTFEADQAGAAGNAISVFFDENSGEGTLTVLITGSGTLPSDPFVIHISTDGLASAETTEDIQIFLNSIPEVNVLVFVSGGSPSVNASTFNLTPLTGGADATTSTDSSSRFLKPSNITPLPNRFTRPAFEALYGFDAETTPPPTTIDGAILTEASEPLTTELNEILLFEPA